MYRYRGRGWPSGIQITLRNGEVVKKDNYTYPWTLMYESLLFRPSRCIKCTYKTSLDADVSLADPWLKEYIDRDRIGNSVIICNTSGDGVIRKMCKDGILRIKKIDEQTYIRSQLGTIETKAKANTYKFFNKIISKMSKEGSIYKRVFTSSVQMIKVHCKIVAMLSFFLKR